MAEHLGFWIREWPSPSSRPSPWGFGGGTTVPEVEEVVLHPGTHRQTLPRQLPSRANPIGPILFDGAAPWTSPTGEEGQSDAFGSSAACPHTAGSSGSQCHGLSGRSHGQGGFLPGGYSASHAPSHPQPLLCARGCASAHRLSLAPPRPRHGPGRWTARHLSGDCAPSDSLPWHHVKLCATSGVLVIASKGSRVEPVVGGGMGVLFKVFSALCVVYCVCLCLHDG